MNQLIETQLTTVTAVTAGSTIPVGSVIHKRGCGLSASGSAIQIRGAGFYKITANLTVAPTAVADMEIVLRENGTMISSAATTPAVAGDAMNVTVIGIVYNPCGCANDQITLTASAAGSVSEMDVIVERM